MSNQRPKPTIDQLQKQTLGVVWKYIKMTGLAMVLIIASTSAAVTMYEFGQTNKGVKVAEQVISGINRLQLALVDSETGQRGYVITGDRGYLDIYDAGLSRYQIELATLTAMIGANPQLQADLVELTKLASPKLSEMAITIVLRQSSFEAARAEIVTQLGKNLMDAVRLRTAAMIAEQQANIIRYEHRANVAASWASACLLISIVSLFLGLLVVYRAADSSSEAAEIIYRGIP